MRVLLTGAGGFIGSHVARALAARGDRVLAVVRRAAPRPGRAGPGGRIISMTADLNRPDEVDALLGEGRPEACVHLAWYAAPGAYLHAAPENLACLAATADLVGRLAAAGCRRFVGAGTCLELDADAGYLAPGTPPGPRSIYAAAKHAAHVLAGQLCRGAGMSFAWVRVFYLYGPGEDPRRLVPHAARSLLRGRRVELDACDPVRDYLHVGDVAEAFAHLLHSGAEGAFHVGSGRPVTVRHLVETLGGLAGRPDLLAFGARPGRPGEPPFLCANPAALRGLGWRPRLGLEDGLRDALRWWRERPDP